MRLPNNQGIFIEFEPDRMLANASSYILPAATGVDAMRERCNEEATCEVVTISILFGYRIGDYTIRLIRHLSLWLLLNFLIP